MKLSPVDLGRLALRSLARSAVVVLVATAVYAQGAEDAAIADQRMPFSGLRHVQLLEVRESDGVSEFEFATAFRRKDGLGEIAVFRRALPGALDVALPTPLGDPSETMVVPFEVVPEWTWLSRVPWRLVTVGDARRVVAVDAAKARLVMHVFPSGEIVDVLSDVERLDDVRVVGDEIEVLYLSDGEVRLLGMSAAGERSRDKAIAGPFDGDIVACFVGATAGGVPTREAVVVGRRGQSLELRLVDLESVESRRTLVEAQPTVWRTRAIAAWRGSEGCYRVAIGQPDAFHGAGRVLLYGAEAEGEILAESGELLLHGAAAGDQDGSAFGGDYGAVVAFGCDADGDGLPELVVGAPTFAVAGHVELIRSKPPGPRTSIHNWVMSRLASSLSVSPCGRYVMAGASPMGYPEQWNDAAWASLIEVRGVQRERVRLHTGAD